MNEANTAPTKKRILILGGGFGGVYAALNLEKKLEYDRSFEVVLLSEDNFFLFTPMLHEVAASDIDPTHIVNPIRQMLRHVTFYEATVEAIDVGAKKVKVWNGPAHRSHEIAFDYLLVALGSESNFFNIEGLEDHCVTMKTLTDAVFLRNRMIATLESASIETDETRRRRLLTFVIAGGGFAGVETMGSVNDFIRDTLRFYPLLRPEEVRMVLVHPQEVILPELGKSLGLYAQKKLAERNVEIITKTRVASFARETVVLSDGRTIPARNLIWTAGVKPSPAIEAIPCKKEKGRIVVNAYFESEDCANIWAVGDCAWQIDPDTGMPYPPTAQHAMRQGKVVAENIYATLSKQPGKTPFRYKMLGQLAAIGKRTGVANIMGLNFSGFVAWWLWRTVYLMKLPGLEKKLRVMIDWTLDLFFTKDMVQFVTLRGVEQLTRRLKAASAESADQAG